MLYVLMGTHMSHIRDFIGYMHELRIYLLCRLACCLIVCATRLVFMHTQLGPRRSHGAGMSLSAMRRSRLFLLGSCYSVATCLFVSYDSLKPLSSFWNWEGSGHSFTDPPQLSSNVAFLVFFPVYALAITAYQFPFQYSLVWVVLTMALAWGGHHMTGLQQLKFAAGGNILVYYTMVNAIEAYCQETLLRGQHQASQRVTFTLDRIQGTLAALMPLDVIRELRESTASLTHSYPSVTLAQSDLAGFTRLASTLSPAKVVELVSELFGRLDKLTDFFEVYKVETVGDAYIAGQGGLPLTRDNSSMAVVCFALRLVEETAMWSESCGVNVGCRVGVHKAACVGGIVGTDMQRYHLFGELMTCVEILESTSHVGKVQVSRACKDAVDEEMRGRGTDVPFRFEARTDESLVTSKGETHPYEDVGGGPTYFATQ
ncbi:unnamed protein product [Prorocentrum cordatum]|uniref:Guanylate cyclase domain-containing protein n=1 Tax=Prorocentrum cordatum TaxID=2364126 RepID=A0ABN9UZK7_9DINO|nr:unnamed protein product [Polarella glacialis]